MRASFLKPYITLTLLLIAVAVQVAHAQSKRELDKSIVWSFYEVDCDLAASDRDRCIVTKMRAGGASSAAVHFAEFLIKEGDSGWAVKFEERGTVDLVTVLHPFRANTNESLVLVNGFPPIIPVDFYQMTAKDKARPDVHKILRRSPDAFLTGRPVFVRTEKLSGGSRYVFADVFAACRACEVLGSGEYGLEFDASGVYRGASFIRAVPNK
jgi:hypothetical protein